MTILVVKQLRLYNRYSEEVSKLTICGSMPEVD